MRATSARYLIAFACVCLPPMASPPVRGGDAPAAAPTAALKLPAIFSDGMVLQRDKHVAELAAWEKSLDRADPGGALPQNAPPRPVAPVRAALHWQPVPGQYNGMLHPLIPYGFRGIAWYQGESNVGKPSYAKHLRLLVADWRKRFGQGDLPFLVCLLPGNGPPTTAIGDSPWAACREAQLAVLDVPNTGVANLIDTCEDGDLHPRNKQDAGERLALVAQGKVYGDETVIWSGPVFESLAIDGSAAVVTFRHADGLAARPLPPTYRPKLWTEPDVTKPLERPSPKSDVQGFAICGADRVWHWADARIDGMRVVVTCDAVREPVAVRYAWADHPICNFVNAAGLPAFPFRSDDCSAAPPGPPSQ